MATEIMLDDWGYLSPDHFSQKIMEIDKAELEKSIQKNRKTIKRIRSNTRYTAILQKIPEIH